MAAATATTTGWMTWITKPRRREPHAPSPLEERMAAIRRQVRGPNITEPPVKAGASVSGDPLLMFDDINS